LDLLVYRELLGLQDSLANREYRACLGTLDLRGDRETWGLLELTERMVWMGLQAFQALLGIGARLGRMEALEYRGSQDLLDQKALQDHQASLDIRVYLGSRGMLVLLVLKVREDIEDQQALLGTQESRDLLVLRDPWVRLGILELQENREILEPEVQGAQGERRESLEAVDPKVYLEWKGSLGPLGLQVLPGPLETPLPSLLLP